MKPSRLEPNTDHSFPHDPPHADWMDCEDCGMPLPPGSEPRSKCKGMKQSKLKRSSTSARKFKNQQSSLSPVSDSNSEGLVTGTELAEWVRGLECLIAAGEPDHRCRGDVIAHHVFSRGSGHGDWRVTGDGRVKGNLVPLCDRAHREVHSDGIRTFEDRYDIGTLESWAKHYGREFPGEPPQRVRDRAQIREGEDGA